MQLVEKHNTMANNAVVRSMASIYKENPETLVYFDAQLTEISDRVKAGDLSDMEAILSNYVVSLNERSA